MSDPSTGPTVIDRPAGRRLPTARVHESSKRDAPRDIDALHAEEAARASGIGLVLAVLAPAALLGLPFQDLPRWLTGLTAGVIIVLMLISVWVWRRAREPARYGRAVFRTYAISCFVAGHVVVYYGGYYSASLIIAVLGLSFFATGDDRRFVIVVGSLFVAAYALIATLIAVDIIPDHSLISASRLGIEAKIFFIAITTACLAVIIWHARLARQATRDAFERLARALRAVQEREALLAEADQDLERARQLAAGRGRFSAKRAGHYALGELVGRGAMGEVYAARHVKLDTRAAVKVLAESVQQNPAFLERFRREARIASQLDSVHVVRVYEFGEIEEGAPFMAMELLSGHDLAWHLRKRRRLALGEVVQLIDQVARGVQAAHEVGIVHRDLKPSNLFLDESGGAFGVWKVLDFGVSKERESTATLTRDALIGTPAYMSPEQARSQIAGTASDVFALGAVAYRALTGRQPFTADDIPQLLYQLVHDQPPQPSALRAGLPSDVDAVLAIALAKEPEERFGSPNELAAALARAVESRLDGEV
jgi:eukaryotic-like serine/threonine-protein kinase